MGTKQQYFLELLRDRSGDYPLLQMNCLGILAPNLRRVEIVFLSVAKDFDCEQLLRARNRIVKKVCGILISICQIKGFFF